MARQISETEKSAEQSTNEMILRRIKTTEEVEEPMIEVVHANQ
jgi:hypothetical protein